MNVIPAIAITSPTPRKPSVYSQTYSHERNTNRLSLPQEIVETPPPVPHIQLPISFPLIQPSYRLLYRGALSLPDSHLLLDGLTFCARLDPTPSKQRNLLENPLALALESMRGRQSLRLLGMVKVNDVWVDGSGNVELDIHPSASLTRIYFDNMFCLLPFPSATPESPGTKSDIGIKVALGDTSGPETTEILISARTLPKSAEINPSIQLTVSRLLKHEPLSLALLPRPDDPIPRRPPLQSMKSTTRELKRLPSTSSLAKTSKRQKIDKPVGGVAADLGRGMRLGVEPRFKVPELPKGKIGKGKEKEKEKPREEVDVFGDVMPTTLEARKGKKKSDESKESNAIAEKENKTVIKKATIKYLAKTKDPTGAIVDKSHTEFKEIYGYVYRGVGFALRWQMKVGKVDLDVVDRLVGIHVDMYVAGARK